MLLFFNVESPSREKLPIFAQIKRIDPIGVLFFAPSMVCVILALQWGGSTYPWSDSKIIGLLVTFAILFIAFIVVEVLTPETAMAPTRVILDRSVGGSMVFVFLLSGALMSIIYYLAVWFQAAKGDSAMQAGISTIPLVLSLVLMGIVGAVCTEKIGYYVPAMLLAPILCSIGAGMLSTFSTRSEHSAWIGYQILYGFGIGFGFQNANLPAQNVLPRADVPLGMAMMFFMQQIGGAVFLAVSQNIFSNTLLQSLSGVVGLNSEAIVNTGATAIRTIVPPDQLETVISAYNYALTRVFILATILSACMILGALPVKWKKMPGKKEKTGEPNVDETKLESGASIAKAQQ